MRPESRLLRQYLRDKAIAGDTAEYAAIDQHVGWEPGSSQGRHRGALTSALRWIEKEHGYSAECVTTVGYKFLRGDSAIVTSEQVRMKKIVAQTQRIADTVDACKADATPERLAIVRTKLNFMEWALDNRTQKILEEEAHKAKEEVRLSTYVENKDRLWKQLQSALTTD